MSFLSNRGFTLLVAVLLTGLSIALNVYGHGRYASGTGLLAGMFFVFSGNLNRDERHRQWLNLPVAFLVCALFIWLIFRLREAFSSVVSANASFLGEIADFLAVSLPGEFGFALIWLNIGLMFCLGVAKFLLLGVMTGIRSILGEDAGQGSAASIYGAYEYRAGEGWVLISAWYFIRHFSVALCALSIVAVFFFWMAAEGFWNIEWLPVLPTCLLLISGEVAAYLGGKAGKAGKVSIAGGSAQAESYANYEIVWKAMQKVWPANWLAASNRDLWGKNER